MSNTKSVVVQFPRSSVEYEYLVVDGDKPEVGDIVITSITWPTVTSYSDTSESALSKASLYGLASVVSLREAPSNKASKNYVHLIPKSVLISAYSIAAARARVHKRRNMARTKLDAMLCQYTDIERYKALAETNPEAAELLKLLLE